VYVKSGFTPAANTNYKVIAVIYDGVKNILSLEEWEVSKNSFIDCIINKKLVILKIMWMGEAYKRVSEG
jgi:hypothetical protein